MQVYRPFQGACADIARGCADLKRAVDRKGIPCRRLAFDQFQGAFYLVNKFARAFENHAIDRFLNGCEALPVVIVVSPFPHNPVKVKTAVPAGITATAGFGIGRVGWRGGFQGRVRCCGCWRVGWRVRCCGCWRGCWRVRCCGGWRGCWRVGWRGRGRYRGPGHYSRKETHGQFSLLVRSSLKIIRAAITEIMIERRLEPGIGRPRGVDLFQRSHSHHFADVFF